MEFEEHNIDPDTEFDDQEVMGFTKGQPVYWNDKDAFYGQRGTVMGRSGFFFRNLSSGEF